MLAIREGGERALQVNGHASFSHESLRHPFYICLMGVQMAGRPGKAATGTLFTLGSHRWQVGRTFTLLLLRKTEKESEQGMQRDGLEFTLFFFLIEIIHRK